MEQPKRWPTILLLIIIQIAWLIVLVIGVVWYIHYRQIRIRPIGVWDDHIQAHACSRTPEAGPLREPLEHLEYIPVLFFGYADPSIRGSSPS